MDKTLTMEPTTEEAVKAGAELRVIFAAIDRIDERIAKNQQETDRIKARTKAKLLRLRAN